MGASFCGTQILGGEHSLHHQKVYCSPVTHGNYGAQSENNSGPVHAHRVVLELPKRAPCMREILIGKIMLDPCDQALPSARFNQTKNRNQQRAKPDEKELEHFVKNRGEQAAGRT